MTSGDPPVQKPISMAKKKRWKCKHAPPCPDPDKYEWVENYDGLGYWRKKRENPTLNSVLQLSADFTRPTNDAAKRVMQRLLPFTQHLLMRRATMRMAGAFKKAMLTRGKMDYGYLADFDFQARDYPIEKLVKGSVFTKEEKGMLYAAFTHPLLNVRQHSELAIGFCMELILVFGDPCSDTTLRIDSIGSDHYFFDDKTNGHDCHLSIQLPERQPWMALFKVNCLGKYIDKQPKYQALKVVRVGNGVS